MFLSMLQYIFIHAEASNTMDWKPSHPIPWTKNHRIQKTCAKIMHKTIGGSAQPKIGSKTKIFRGAAPDPIKWGYGYTSNPLWPPLATQSVQQRGWSAPPLTPQLTMWACHGKNITQPNIIHKVISTTMNNLKNHFTFSTTKNIQNVTE